MSSDLSPPGGKKGKERRRYPRVRFEASPLTFDVSVLGFGSALVYDMSFSGAALAQPRDQKVPEDSKEITIRLQTTSEKDAVDCQIQCQVIRCTDKNIALEFTEVPVEARLLIDQVISDRVIGLNMNLIDPRHYSPSSSFSYWFHGPKETNLFLWEQDGGAIERAQFDLHNFVLLYENDAFLYEAKTGDQAMPPVRPQQVLHKAISILSQMQTNLESLGEFQVLLEDQIL